MSWLSWKVLNYLEPFLQKNRSHEMHPDGLWTSAFTLCVLTSALSSTDVPRSPETSARRGPPSLKEDPAHLKEHLKEMIDVADTMSPEELEFHYFKVHDYNKDNQLDGLEMLHALMHNEHERGAVSMPFDQPIDTEQYIKVIDEILADGDLNGDGYLSYEEYKHRAQMSG